MNNREKRAAVLRALDSMPCASSRYIARQVGVSGHYVSSVRPDREGKRLGINGRWHPVAAKPSKLSAEEASLIDRERSEGIYAIEAVTLHGMMIKVGWSKNIERRVATLVRDHAPARLIATCAGTRRHEKEIHARMAGHRVRGEWFKCTINDVVVSMFCASDRVRAAGFAHLYREIA